MDPRDLKLYLRLLAVAAVTVLVQTTAVSQITIFGVSADLSPLVVMSVGLLAGSIPGALMGFVVGLSVDTALLQTLGVSSLIYIVIGYGAGRLRELRDPAHGLIPLAVGIVATAVATVGLSLAQFLLGIDSPVSWLLVRQLVVTVLVGALLSLPVYILIRRVLSRVLPEDPRRRRRRTYTTGGLSPISRA